MESYLGMENYLGAESHCGAENHCGVESHCGAGSYQGVKSVSEWEEQGGDLGPIHWQHWQGFDQESALNHCIYCPVVVVYPPLPSFN